MGGMKGRVVGIVRQVYGSFGEGAIDGDRVIRELLMSAGGVALIVGAGVAELGLVSVRGGVGRVPGVQLGVVGGVDDGGGLSERHLGHSGAAPHGCGDESKRGGQRRVELEAARGSWKALPEWNASGGAWYVRTPSAPNAQLHGRYRCAPFPSAPVRFRLQCLQYPW